MPTDPHWLTSARRYLGIAVVQGPHHHTAIRHLLDAADGKTEQGIRDDETPWCASFVSGVLEFAGIHSAQSAWARSYVKWGKPLAGAAPGAIAVLERGPTSGHVGFVVGITKNGNAAGRQPGGQGVDCGIRQQTRARLSMQKKWIF